MRGQLKKLAYEGKATFVSRTIWFEPKKVERWELSWLACEGDVSRKQNQRGPAW